MISSIHLTDHLRLIWPQRRFVTSLNADGTSVVFEDGQPMPTDDELAATQDRAIALLQAEREAADLPPPISRRQMHLWLLDNGLLEAVPSLISNLPDPAQTRARIEWETATEFAVTHPLVATFAGHLGFGKDALHAAWRAAAVL